MSSVVCEKCLARSDYKWADCPLRLSPVGKFRKGVNKGKRGCSEFATDHDVYERIRNMLNSDTLQPFEVPYAMAYARKHDKGWYQSYFERRSNSYL